MGKSSEDSQKGSFIKTINFCMKLAWTSSKAFTILRIFGRIINPINGILLAFLTKYIIDILSQNIETEKAKESIIFLVAVIVFINLLNIVAQKISEYATIMQNDLIKKSIDLDVMEFSATADLELFDTVEYYDKFAIVQRDSQAMSNILWSTLNFLSNAIAMIGAL